MKKLLVMLMALLMVLVLCGCNFAVDPDSVAGVAVEQAVTVVARFLESVILVAGTWVLSKIGKEKSLNNTTKAMGLLFDVTRQTVGELQQTVVDYWKKASDGGKLTDEQIRYLHEELLRLVKLKLDEPTKALIIAGGADLDALITGAAESYIGINAVSVF